MEDYGLPSMVFSDRQERSPNDEWEINDGDISRLNNPNKEQISEEDNPKSIFMSVVKKGPLISVSYYDAESCHLHILPDTTETEDCQMIRRVLFQTEPDVVITTTKQDETIMKILKGEENSNQERVVQKQWLLELLPNATFGYETCKRRLFAIKGLPGLQDNCSETEREVYLNSIISCDSVNAIRATGSLLKYLDKTRIGVELEDCTMKTPLLALRTISLDGMMFMDENSYSSLQIFNREAHPSAYKAGTGNSSKEGLSLFGIMNYAKSLPGSRLLRLWFLQPVTDLAIIQSRLKQIQYFYSPKNLEAFITLQDCLKHTKNVSRILSKMLSAGATVSDWQNLYKTVYNAICIREICQSLPQDLAIVQKINVTFSQDLHKIAHLINRIVDFDESLTCNRFVVKLGIDPELDEKKRTYNGLPDLMTRVAQEELSRLDSTVTECSVIYLPQLGYLLAVPRTSNSENEEDFEKDNLEFLVRLNAIKIICLEEQPKGMVCVGTIVYYKIDQFYTSDTVHYKSKGTRELDIILGDTQCDITDHETAIMHRLQLTILDHTDILLKVVEISAELDCILALTTAAKEYNYACPNVTQDKYIDIVNGRHPLQELCVKQFVPNHTRFSEDSLGDIKVLTGPNACGKSVYLKQVGLIVFLSHIGSFVPAESASIGITDRLFTRIHTRETVSVPLSTFMIDLNQMASAVRDATEKSLVLIDEFGKGTASTDGLALLTAVLEHWLIEPRNGCPRVIVSTHFHGLIQQKLLPETEAVEFLTMEVMQDEGDLVFLHKLANGHSGCSYACHVAKEAGIPPEIIARGIEVSQLLRECRTVQKILSPQQALQNQRLAQTNVPRSDVIAQRFLDLDICQSDCYTFLHEFVLPLVECTK